MADDISVIPITDEQAKLGQEIVGALRGVGAFFKEALGSMPQDIIGYLGGDWLRIRRAKNIAEMLNKTKKDLNHGTSKTVNPRVLQSQFLFFIVQLTKAEKKFKIFGRDCWLLQ